MSDIDRITAGEIRALGIPVPDQVPDCGNISRAGFQAALGFAMSHAKLEASGHTMTMDMSIKFDEPFEWVDVTVEVTKGPK